MSLTLIRISHSHDIIPCVAAPCHMLWHSVTLPYMCVTWTTSTPRFSSPVEPGRLDPIWGPCTASMGGLPTPRLLTTRAAPRQATVHDSAGLTLSLPRVLDCQLTVQGHCTSGTVHRVGTVAKSICKLPLVVQVRLRAPVERMCVALLAFAAILWPPFVDISASPFPLFLVAFPMPLVRFFSG